MSGLRMAPRMALVGKASPSGTPPLRRQVMGTHDNTTQLIGRPGDGSPVGQGEPERTFPRGPAAGLCVTG